MKKSHNEVQSRWLASRAPSQRNGDEALKFSDECWVGGLRLATSPIVHYELVMANIRWSLIH